MAMTHGLLPWRKWLLMRIRLVINGLTTTLYCSMKLLVVGLIMVLWGLMIQMFRWMKLMYQIVRIWLIKLITLVGVGLAISLITVTPTELMMIRLVVDMWVNWL